jgi:hypothetical protein
MGMRGGKVCCHREKRGRPKAPLRQCVCYRPCIEVCLHVSSYDFFRSRAVSASKPKPSASMVPGSGTTVNRYQLMS